MTIPDDNKGLQHYIEEESYVETGMDTREMWRPAIIVNAHSSSYEPALASHGKKARVRPQEDNHFGSKKHPCAGKGQWFEVHPDDCAQLGWEGGLGCCEHEILTD